MTEPLSWRDRLQISGAFVAALLLGDMAEPVFKAVRGTWWVIRKAVAAISPGKRRHMPSRGRGVLEANPPRDLG